MKQEKLEPIMQDFSVAAEILDVLSADIRLGTIDLPVCIQVRLGLKMGGDARDGLANRLHELSERLTGGTGELERVMAECATQVRVHQEIAQAARRAQYQDGRSDTFEHRVVITRGSLSPQEMEQELDSMGVSGWKLVSVRPGLQGSPTGPTMFWLFFRRRSRNVRSDTARVEVLHRYRIPGVERPPLWIVAASPPQNHVALWAWYNISEWREAAAVATTRDCRDKLLHGAESFFFYRHGEARR